MSSRGFPLYLLAIAALLIGLSVYLSVSAVAVTPPGVDVEAAGLDSDSGPPNIEAGREVVRVSITTRDRGRVLAPWDRSIRCELRLGRSSIAADATLVAGPGAALREDAVGRHLVRYTLADGSELFRIVHLGSVADVAAVAMAAETEIRGVVTGPDGNPVVDAEVWTGSSVGGELRFTHTDADGRFVARERFGGEGIPLVVRSAGLASRFRVLDVLDGGEDASMRLERGTSMRVQFAAVLDEPERGRVAIIPASTGVALRHYPFFMGVFDGAFELDADAACEIRDLPRDGQVQVVVSHPDTVTTSPVSASLARVDQAAVVVTQQASEESYRARVVDERGEPIDGARIELRRKGRAVWTRAQGWMLPPDAHRVDGRVAMTDAQGLFRIGRSRRASTLSVRAPGFCGVELALPSRRPGPAEITLPPLVADADAGPALRFELDRAGRRCLVRTNGGEWQEWPDGEPIEVAVDEPALLDIEVRVDAGAGSDVVRRSYPGQPVVGPVVFELH